MSKIYHSAFALIADEKKVKAIFTMVADELEDYGWAKDKKFLAELDKRSADYKSGMVKGISWDHAKKQILEG